MQKVCAKLVAKELNDQNKAERFSFWIVPPGDTVNASF